jgi:hypothetical protein
MRVAPGRLMIVTKPVVPEEERAMEIRRKFWVEERSHAIWAVELHDHAVHA